MSRTLQKNKYWNDHIGYITQTMFVINNRSPSKGSIWGSKCGYKMREDKKSVFSSG